VVVLGAAQTATRSLLLKMTAVRTVVKIVVKMKLKTQMKQKPPMVKIKLFILML
jgi:hypothetical protein